MTKFKLMLFYIFFELLSFKVFKIMFYSFKIGKYDYVQWVYYFYNPSKNLYFFYYLYFIFTTSIFFILYLWISYSKRYKVDND